MCRWLKAKARDAGAALSCRTSVEVGTAVLTIRVYSAPVVESGVTKSGYKNSGIAFSSSDFTGSCDMSGMPLQSVEITPSGTGGTWYAGSASFTGARVVTSSQISQLRFVSADAGTFSFTWRASNAAGFSGYGNGTITVSNPTLTLANYTSSSNISRGETWAVQPSHFSSNPSVTLSYVKITAVPAAADGSLYLSTALAANASAGYPAISANQTLAAGAVIPFAHIQHLRLSTQSAGTASSVAFSWTATTDGTAPSASWAGAASYTVRFLSLASVSYSTYENLPVNLEAEDFKDRFSDALSSGLAYVTFELPDKTAGTLYLDYNPAAKGGTAVSATVKYYASGNPGISHVAFVPAAGFKGTAIINYKAYGASGGALNGTLYITVSESPGGTVAYTIDKNAAVQMDASDFAKSFLNATGNALVSVKFSQPSRNVGTLYYDYAFSSDYDSVVSDTKKYYVYSSSYLSYVSFVPKEGYTGTAVISYTAYGENGAGQTGRLIVFVADSPAGIVSYTSKVNGLVPLAGRDFSEEFISVTGSVLSYVQFTPPNSSTGALYLNYSASAKKNTAVNASGKYYDGSSPDISNITFIPAKDFSGEVTIPYKVYTAAGTAYAGKLKIKVGTSSSGTISYGTELNKEVAFAAADFKTKFYSNTGGTALSYVAFALPPASSGTLYCGLAAVSEGAVYYADSGSPSLSNVRFVPKTGYSGSVSFSYTGYAADGTGYSGKVNITVGSGEGSVFYETSQMKPVKFKVADFREAFASDSDDTLYYVRFTPPDASSGKLYYGYTSASNYTSLVSAGTKYYASSNPALSSVAFVPGAGFYGTISIPYTAYGTDGSDHAGTVVVTVLESAGGTVQYDTDINMPVRLDAEDFGSSFLDQAGLSLSYVRFTLPPSSSGTLYYGYSSPTKYASKVSSSGRYYRTSSPGISDVTFVPAADYSGTVKISYTGYTSSSEEYEGVLLVNVRHPFTDVGTGYSWASAAVARLYNKGVVQGTGSALFNPAGTITRGDFMLMVYRAFDLRSGISGNFSDVPEGSYYYNAIAVAKELGIATGSGGKFYPASPISRQDAMVILLRAMRVAGTAPGAGGAAELSAFSDGDRVSSYAVEAVGALVKAGVITGTGGKINPTAMVSRAEMAVMLDRALEL